MAVAAWRLPPTIPANNGVGNAQLYPPFKLATSMEVMRPHLYIAKRQYMHG